MCGIICVPIYTSLSRGPTSLSHIFSLPFLRSSLRLAQSGTIRFTSVISLPSHHNLPATGHEHHSRHFCLCAPSRTHRQSSSPRPSRLHRSSTPCSFRCCRFPLTLLQPFFQSGKFIHQTGIDLIQCLTTATNHLHVLNLPIFRIKLGHVYAHGLPLVGSRNRARLFAVAAS